MGRFSCAFPNHAFSFNSDWLQHHRADVLFPLFEQIKWSDSYISLFKIVIMGSYQRQLSYGLYFELQKKTGRRSQCSFVLRKLSGRTMAFFITTVKGMVLIISYGLSDLITFSISSAKDGATVLMTSLQSMTLNFPECYQG